MEKIKIFIKSHSFIYLILLLIFFTACSTELRTIPLRFETSETQGKKDGQGIVSLSELKLGTGTTIPISSIENINGRPLELESQKIKEAKTILLGSLSMTSLLDRLDFTYFAQELAPTIFGVKYQLIGDTKSKAQKNNFSTSIYAGYGVNLGSEYSIFDSKDQNNKKNRNLVYHTSYELGTLIGYRFTDNFIFYSGYFFGRTKSEIEISFPNEGLIDIKGLFITKTQSLIFGERYEFNEKYFSSIEFARTKINLRENQSYKSQMGIILGYSF
jgi:hypothetical protein